MKDNYVFIGVATIVVCVLIFFFGYTNFSSTSSPVMNTNNQTTTLVPFTKLVQGVRSTVPTRTNYLITSSDELKLLWKMIDATSTPPKVDFEKSTVVAVFAGKGSDTAIAVAKIEDANTRLVSVEIMTPKTACMKKTGASPYELVMVPKTSLEFAHQDITSPINCQN